MSLEDVPDRVVILAQPSWVLHQLTEAWDMSPAVDNPPHLPNMLFSLEVKVVILNSIRNNKTKQHTTLKVNNFLKISDLKLPSFSLKEFSLP